ncbi:unnamed protein product [Durusdinium trenchii]|uniref:EF-hand domain-containing protein n=2 Tax=Durusdinium trenchii TaxID=1381693 RepID=A0ABP0NKX6_9DINO
MYLNKERIRCASLASGVLGLVGSALFLSAIFLPWWDVGSPEELLNLQNAPPVVSSLWDFYFLNPPSWVTSPMPREPSSWQAYCARDAERAKADSVAEPPEELNDTEDTTGTTTTVTSTSLDTVTSVDMIWTNESKDSNDSNASSTTTVSVTRTRTMTSTTITTMTTMDPALLQEQRSLTTPIPDPPLHPGTCELVPFLPTLLCAASALGPGAVLLFFSARYFSSLLGLMAGALAAASACGLGAIAIFMAGFLSLRGLMSAAGPQLVLGGMAFAGGSAVLAVYNSVKVLKPVETRQPALGGEAEDSGDEEDKSPEAIAQRKKRDEERMKLPRMERFKAAAEREARKQRITQKKVEVKQRPEAMLKLLNWGHRSGQGGRFGKKVPVKWIEDAFNEIDTERHGAITLEEFMTAVGKCGLLTSRASFERILNEINQDRKGMLDLREFVSFFRMVEEGLKKDARGKSRALMSLYLCNFCFFIHVAILCAILIIIVRREVNASPEDLADPLHQAEGQLLSTTLQLIAVSMFGFFVSVVALPLLRVTIGSSIGAWCRHFSGVIRETRRRWRGEEPGDERNAGADLEAGTPMSRRNSNASFGTGGAMSKTLSTTSRTSRGVSSRGMSRRSSNSDATLSRRISVSSIPSRGSLGSNSSQKPWWKRISGKLFPTKRKRRRRRGSRVEDSAYDMSKYEDANLRAMAAMIEPVSTFSPMQVRNLHVAHLPSVVAAEPPTQLAPYLPGTPAGIYSQPTSECALSRPMSREHTGRRADER